MPDLSAARMRWNVQQHLLSEDAISRVLMYVLTLPVDGIDKKQYEELDFVHETVAVMQTCKQVCVWWCIVCRRHLVDFAKTIVLWARNPRLLPWRDFSSITRASRMHFLVGAMKVCDGDCGNQFRILKLIHRRVTKRLHFYFSDEFDGVCTQLVRWTIKNEHFGLGCMFALQTMTKLAVFSSHSRTLCTECFLETLMVLMRRFCNCSEIVRRCCDLINGFLSCRDVGCRAVALNFMTQSQNFIRLTDAIELFNVERDRNSYATARCSLLELLSTVVRLGSFNATSRTFERVCDAVVTILCECSLCEETQLKCLLFIIHASQVSGDAEPMGNRYGDILMCICRCAENNVEQPGRHMVRMPYHCSKVLNIVIVKLGERMGDVSLSLQKWVIKTVMLLLCSKFSSNFSDNLTKKNSFDSLKRLICHGTPEVMAQFSPEACAVLNAYLDWTPENRGWGYVKSLPWNSLTVLMDGLDIITHLGRHPVLLTKFLASGGHWRVLNVLLKEDLYGLREPILIKAMASIKCLVAPEAQGLRMGTPLLYAEDLRDALDTFAFRGMVSCVSAASELMQLLPRRVPRN